MYAGNSRMTTADQLEMARLRKKLKVVAKSTDNPTTQPPATRLLGSNQNDHELLCTEDGDSDDEAVLELNVPVAMMPQQSCLPSETETQDKEPVLQRTKKEIALK